MMRDVAPGFLRPNPNPSSQDVPGPWFRLLYIIHPHQSMSIRPAASIGVAGARRPRPMVFSCWFATGVSGDDDRSRAQQLVFPWRYQTSVCCLRDSSPVHLYCLACTISSIGLMVTMMTTIMFCFLAKKKTIW
jgi:hypothetical protein